MPYAPPTHRAAHMPSREQAKRYSNKEYNATQRTGQEFYDSPAWRKLRTWHIKQNPVCVDCEQEGIAKIADVVDHITPIKQGGSKLCLSNLQSLCHRHHNAKSAAER